MSQNRGTLQEQKRKINKKENFKCNPPPTHRGFDRTVGSGLGGPDHL